ncbi:MAG TPA: outer membrane protein assembly factor BamA [Thermomicrobiales bacterium]|nr:outer membrane protein assembly factor BamA [Thermomicrobiales bacterium]
MQRTARGAIPPILLAFLASLGALAIVSTRPGLAQSTWAEIAPVSGELLAQASPAPAPRPSSWSMARSDIGYPDPNISSSIAQGEMGVVQAIRVEGTQRVDPQTVRSYLTVREGDLFDAPKIDASLKALFATGYFADVNVRREGGDLVIRVSENPIINRVAFEGNRRIESSALTSEVQSKPRQVYTRTRVQNDVKRILDLYRRSGRFAASVEPKIIFLEQNRVDLVFEIEEGKATAVDRIAFVGNEKFDDGDLRGVIRTRESRWWRLLGSNDIYDPDRIAFDRELLRRHYLSEGYADFRVVTAVAELAQDRSGFIITFGVDEGERYKFGDVKVVSQLPDLNTEQLASLVEPSSGDWYSSARVESTVEKLTQEVGRYGYAFVDVRPRITRNRDQRQIDVAFEVGEGPRVYVDRIEIEGNMRTLDRVIRREFRLAEGDAFNSARIRRTRQRLINLGYFEKVEITNVPSEQPDRTTLKVAVQEKSTGELSLGAGYSTTQGVLADIGIRERNLLGRGQDLRLGLQLSERQQQIDLGFTEPYFLERPLLAGVDLFRIVRDNTDESSYDLDTGGFSLRMGYRITEPLSQRLRYTLRRDEIDPNSQASRFIQKEEGVKWTSAIGQDLVYDTRDNRFDPTEGYVVSLSNEFGGLWGDRYYLRTEVAGTYYYSLIKDWVIGLSAKAGYVFGIGQAVDLRNRFFKGGDSFHGFAVGGLGPRANITCPVGVACNDEDDALGGNKYYIASAEMNFPLGLPEELGLKGRVFADFGALWGIDEDSDPEIQDSASPRLAVGIGLIWKSPFGPIRIDFSEPVIKQDFDKVNRFLFSFGTRF